MAVFQNDAEGVEQISNWTKEHLCANAIKSDGAEWYAARNILEQLDCRLRQRQTLCYQGKFQDEPFEAVQRYVCAMFPYVLYGMSQSLFILLLILFDINS